MIGGFGGRNGLGIRGIGKGDEGGVRTSVGVVGVVAMVGTWLWLRGCPVLALCYMSSQYR